MAFHRGVGEVFDRKQLIWSWLDMKYGTRFDFLHFQISKNLSHQSGSKFPVKIQRLIKG